MVCLFEEELFFPSLWSLLCRYLGLVYNRVTGTHSGWKGSQKFIYSNRQLTWTLQSNSMNYKMQNFLRIQGPLLFCYELERLVFLITRPDSLWLYQQVSSVMWMTVGTWLLVFFDVPFSILHQRTRMSGYFSGIW